MVRPGDRNSTRQGFEFMKANQATWPLATMARLLKVSRSGFHAWNQRQPSAHAKQDRDLLARIRAIYTGSHGTYGMPRIHATLARQGIHVGRKRVARLMREAGLRGVSRRRWVKTTRRAPGARPAPDLVQRHFQADVPNRLWVADATYIPTAAGFFYLTVVLGVQPAHCGLGHGQPSAYRADVAGTGYGARAAPPRGCHSPLGSRLPRRIQPVVATPLIKEVFMGRPAGWMQKLADLFEYIEVFYNRSRRHSSLGFVSPVQFLQDWLKAQRTEDAAA
ncbi:IS3 family transposase [Cupriavidus sp. WKF15]|uniref:IS3 family transposase n=1 Tax=Cupriavidus sp. WKF15 TaxID=3032282 RepID=UPI0023E20755|nr:IS3 family transposase [Cupriavidus sp. WKF15]WER50420.1 IS3 family transposase [Cupriavidus sp. WKF15]